MKKIIFWLLLLGTIWVGMASTVYPSDLYRVPRSYIITPETVTEGKSLDLAWFKHYTPCWEFSLMQEKYKLLRNLWFIVELWVQPEDYRLLYANYFSKLARSTPQNLIQKSLFPYANIIHAEQGKGVQTFCAVESENFYQMGTLQAKGSVVLKDIFLEGMDGTTANAKEAYFALSEIKDPHIASSPYLQIIDGKKSLFLWCFADEKTSNILYFDALALKIDAKNNSYYLSSSVRENAAVAKTLRKSAQYPEKEITLNMQLLPNVIFDHELNIPCENSRIQDIAVIDDAGLGDL